NTVAQMETCLSDLFDLENQTSDSLHQALRETEEAIRQVLGGASEVELSPQNAYVRRRQHELTRAANLLSYSVGEGSNRRVRIYREE
ncbi:MAG TPA: AAA family ATPase, partial [Anaerolineae bacterium]|nr:AAA family ATPase [Anaerolineae bacterium]